MLLDNHTKQSPIVGVAGLGGGINSYIFLSSGGDYVISRSLKFNPNDSPSLTRTPSSVGNRKVFTISLWAKKSKIGGTYEDLFTTSTGGQFRFIWEPDGNLEAYSANGGTTFHIDTVARFRDPNAWYHFVLSIDAANTSVKFYVNGVELTEFVVHTAVQNTDTIVNTTTQHTIGYNSSGQYFDGYLADYNFVDGQALSPTSFGKFDTSGVWQPKEFSGSHGTNGFHLDFKDNSSNAALGYDAAGSNNWTVNNLVANTTPFNTVGATSGLLGSNIVVNRPGSYNFAHVSSSIGSDPGDAAFLKVNFASLGLTAPATITFDSYQQGGGGWSVVPSTVYTDAGNTTSSSTSSGNTRSNTISIPAGATYFAIPPSWTSASGGILSNGIQNLVWNGTAVTFYDGNGDSLLDTPTNGDVTDDSGSGGQIIGNFATLNALNADNQGTLSNGNLDVTGTPGFHGISNMGMSSGKWYAEVTGMTGGGASNYLVGVCDITQFDNSNVWDAFSRGYGYRNDSKKINSNNASTYGATYTTSDVIGIAFDYDNGTLEFYKNGVSQGTAFSGISRTVNSGTVGVVRYFFASFVRTSSDKITWNFGQRPFFHNAPSGFKTLCTSNISQTIDDPSEYFDTKLFTGNGSTQYITGLNFSPSFVWIKQKNATRDHILLDVVRGTNKVLYSNLASRDDTYTNTLTSFDSNGFTLGGNNLSNTNTGQYVSWAWNAGSTTASNSDGDITSQVRASQASGFSIVKYTGVGGSTKAIGHGLNNKPKFIFIKRIDASADWPSYILSHTTYFLNTTAGSINDDNYFHGDYKPTTSVFTVGTHASVNADGGEYIAYVWAPIEGYSEMGSFSGNSNVNGVFQYTGFKVKWLLIKQNGTKSWQLIDAARSPTNVTDDRLFPDDTGAESTSSNFDLDFVSNGFKCRANHASSNIGQQTWMAFAEHPFKTARAR